MFTSRRVGACVRLGLLFGVYILRDNMSHKCRSNFGSRRWTVFLPRDLGAMPPRTRPAVHYFDSVALGEKLKGLANLKEPGFDWTGALYPSTKRGLVPDHAGLVRHHAVLREVLSTARSTSNMTAILIPPASCNLGSPQTWDQYCAMPLGLASPSCSEQVGVSVFQGHERHVLVVAWTIEDLRRHG